MTPIDEGLTSRVVGQARELASEVRAWTTERVLEEARALGRRTAADGDRSELLPRSLAISREALLRERGVETPESAMRAAAAMAVRTRRVSAEFVTAEAGAGPFAVIPGRQRRQVYAACVNLAACGEPGIHNHRR